MAKLIKDTYALALFELAVEEKKTDAVFEQIDVLEKELSDNPDFIALLSHPQITKEEKISVVEKTFTGRIDDDIVSLFKVIVDKDRAKDILGILGCFKNHYYEYKKIGIVTVSSASPLKSDQKKKIEDKLLATTGFKELKTNYIVDKDLIGGVVIRIGDRVVDSSIKNKLDRMTGNLRKISI